MDTSSLLVGAKYQGDCEEQLKVNLKEEFTAPSGQINFFIDEIHTVVVVVGVGRSHIFPIFSNKNSNLLSYTKRWDKELILIFVCVQKM